MRTLIFLRPLIFLINVIYLISYSGNCYSQDTLLTLDIAIETLLKNNYDVKIINAQDEKYRNDNTAGNAGMLPDVNADASYLRTNAHVEQTYSNGNEVNSSNSGTTLTNANVNAEWTVFNGLKMFATKNRLEEEYKQSADRMMIQMENSIVDLISTYFTIVRQSQLLRALKEEMKLSDERVLIADRKLKNGSGSRLEWLNMKTEYNRQYSLLIGLQSQIAGGQIRVNTLLGRNPESAFSVQDTVVINYKPDFEQLKKTVMEQNSTLKFYSKDVRIAELRVKEAKALRAPEINLNARYGFTKTSNDAGFILLNQSNGFSYGAYATIPLFSGFNIRRQVRNAKLDASIAGLNFESYTLQVSEALLNAWRDFNNNMQLLKLEEDNIGFAIEVLKIANERYRIGSSSAVELQEAQRTFEEAMVRVADARFNTKMSETTLRKLNGELIVSTIPAR